MIPDPSEKKSLWVSPMGLTLCVFLAVAALFLILEHRAHLLGAWPILLLILCFGMHFFMHRRHGGHGSHRGHSFRNESDGNGR
jgi:hypothetical protein